MSAPRTLSARPVTPALPATAVPWRAPARLAIVLVLAMLAIFVGAGIGQDPLQSVHSPATYAALLARGPDWLRCTLGLDNLFVLAYGTVFLTLGQRLWTTGRPRALVACGTGLMGLTALMDLGENLHFLVMLQRAALDLSPSSGQIALQAWESMMKFHVSYLGLALIGLALPSHTPVQRGLRWLLIGVQAPVGIAIYVVPQALAVPLVFVRFGFFLAALALVSVMPLPASDDSGGPA